MAAIFIPVDNSSFPSSSLRRSQSQPKFGTQPAYIISTKSSAPFNLSSSLANSNTSSPTSSPCAIHADSTAPSTQSTLTSSSFFLDAECKAQTEDHNLFPSYDNVRYCKHTEDWEAPLTPRTGSSYTVSTTSDGAFADVSRPQFPDMIEHPQDDTAVKIQPSRHVDYLSHSWKEEDIWSSWKHVVSKHKAYASSARLENAFWRTWMKSKYKLSTVSPETLDWLKVCDVTWLYGPLQTSADVSLRVTSNSPIGSSRLLKSASFLHKRSILKKRNVSEIMLRRSFSSSSLLKRVTAAVHVQQSGGSLRAAMDCATSDYVNYAISPRFVSHDPSTMMSSISSSGLATHGIGERKHIRFNEQVEQCIALEVKRDDDDAPDPYLKGYDSSASEDDAILMNGHKPKSELPASRNKRTTPRSNFDTAEIKTFAMLPSTTLKYRGETPELPEITMKHSNLWNEKLSPFPSQESLRTSKPSSRLFDDEGDSDEFGNDWSHEKLPASKKSDSSSNIIEEPSGMRRTPSGMSMPYEKDEEEVVSERLFGNLVDSINTAKDIAHVIWSVGWRR